MTIKFTKERINNHMIFGMVWLVLGAIAVSYDVDNILSYGYLLMAILYFASFLFEKNKQYLTIENGIITKNRLIPIRINLDEITRIKKFAGDYTLVTDTTQLKINTQLIEKKSLAQLDVVLGNLNIKPQ